MTASRSRPVLSLLAAYVIVLQALLLPMTVATTAAFDGSLCATAAAGHPAGDQPGCPCSAGCGMQCCVQTLAAPPPVSAFVVELPRGEILSLPQSLAAGYFAHERPQTARAPPAA